MRQFLLITDKRFLILLGCFLALSEILFGQSFNSVGFVGNLRRPSSATNASYNIPIAGLREYWRLDETSGTRVGIINAFNLTDNNSTPSDVGLITNAAATARTGAKWLSRAAGDFSTSIAQPFAVVAAVKWSALAADENAILTLRDGTTGDDSFELNVSATLWNFNLIDQDYNIDQLNTNANITADVWHIVQAGFDGTKFWLRIDLTNYVEQNTILANLGTGNVPFGVGAYGNATLQFNGLIDEAQFWNTNIVLSVQTNLYLAMSNSVPYRWP